MTNNSNKHNPHNTTANKLKDNKGMTLLEIMIVLVILGSLVGILATNITGQLEKSRQKNAKIQIGEMMKQLEAYNLDCGSYPTSEQGLEALLKNPGDCDEWGPRPYIKKKSIPKDPWNNEYIYENDGSIPVIISLGKDKADGGEGLDSDISSED